VAAAFAVSHASGAFSSRAADACLPGQAGPRPPAERPERDPSDSRWLAACFERGAVTGCFVATPEFRLIREHTRYRSDLTGDRTWEKQRAEKLLEAAIKLSSVLTDLHGVTGRDIMGRLIVGERDPKALAELARGRARRKIAELEHAPALPCLQLPRRRLPGPVGRFLLALRAGGALGAPGLQLIYSERASGARPHCPSRQLAFTLAGIPSGVRSRGMRAECCRR
jgi:hypothetical protein